MAKVRVQPLFGVLQRHTLRGRVLGARLPNKPGRKGNMQIRSIFKSNQYVIDPNDKLRANIQLKPTFC